MASIIKANQFQDFNGNSILTSDGAGNLTTQKINYPAFRASMSATQSIGDDVRTLVQYDTVDYDTDSAYDNSASNYKFTIPSGKGGKYVIYAQAYGEAGTNNNAHTEINIYKNGSILTNNETIFGSNYITRTTQSIISTFDLLAGDYIQIYLRVNDTSGTPQILRTSNNQNWFGAYRIGS